MAACGVALSGSSERYAASGHQDRLWRSCISILHWRILMAPVANSLTARLPRYTHFRVVAAVLLFGLAIGAITPSPGQTPQPGSGDKEPQPGSPATGQNAKEKANAE